MLGLSPTSLTQPQSSSARFKVAMYSTSVCCAFLIITALSVSDCLNSTSNDDSGTTQYMDDVPSGTEEQEVTDKAPTNDGSEDHNTLLPPPLVGDGDNSSNTSLLIGEIPKIDKNVTNAMTTEKADVGVTAVNNSKILNGSKDSNSTVGNKELPLYTARNTPRETDETTEKRNRKPEDINTLTKDLAETIQLAEDNRKKSTSKSNLSEKTTGLQDPVITTSPKSEVKPVDTISVKMFRAEGEVITVEDLTLPGTRVFLNHTKLKAYSVDYHYKKRLIFYTAFGRILRDEVVGRLARTDLPTMVVSVGAEGAVSLAVDWVHDKLYWMSHRQQTVEVTDLDGANRTLVIDKFRGMAFPNNLAVDPYRRYLFIVVNGSIYRTDLDGKGLMELPSEGARVLTLDRQGQRVLYSGKRGNYNSGKVFIGSCDYDGLQCKDLSLDGRWNDIFSLDYFRNTLYFAHYSGGSVPDAVWSADISQNPMKPSFRGSSKELWSVKVYHPEAQQELTTKKS